MNPSDRDDPEVKALLQYISATPLLLSLLYDIDLLPEQCDVPSEEWKKCLLIAMHFRQFETKLSETTPAKLT